MQAFRRVLIEGRKGRVGRRWNGALRGAINIRHDISPDRRNVDQIGHRPNRPVRVLNGWGSGVKVGVVYFDLRLEAVGVARKSQENVFGVDDAEESRTESVEAIHEVAAPESSSPAFSISMTVQTVGESLKVDVLALLELHIQSEPAGSSDSSSTGVPRIVRVVSREVVESEDQS